MEEIKIGAVEMENSEEHKKSEIRGIVIDPNILIDCIEYTNDVVNGYAAIYKNFQNILWTMRRRGVSPSDAAAATVEIVNKAAAKAQEMVPHKDPFEELEEKSDDDEVKKEETSDDDTM